MELKVTRYALEIIPEDERDEAYIEEVLKLRKHGDFVKLYRNNATGLNCIALLTTSDFMVKRKQEEL